MTIRISLVDDHAPFRTCLKELLQQQAGLSVIAEDQQGDAAVRAIEACPPQERPDVLLMDVDMPMVDGIEATRRLFASAPACRVLALSSHDDPSFVTAMVAAGARGYMLKDDPLDQLVCAIRDVAAGRTHFSATLTPGQGAPLRLGGGGA